MICILGTILGGIFGILLAFVSHYSSGAQRFTDKKKPVILKINKYYFDTK